MDLHHLGNSAAGLLLLPGSTDVDRLKLHPVQNWSLEMP